MAKKAESNGAENQNADNQNAETPSFRLLGQFIRDMSFECPAAPALLDPNEKNNLEFNFGVASRRLNETQYEVTLNLRGENLTEKKQPIYMIELQYAGVFELKGIAAEQMHMLLGIEAPALLYPFARQKFMATIMDSGFRAPMLEPLNFHALFMQAQQQQAQQTKTN